MKNEIRQMTLIGFALALVIALLILGLTSFDRLPNQDDQSTLDSFDSYEDLENFVESSQEETNSYGSGIGSQFGLSQFEMNRAVSEGIGAFPAAESSGDSAKAAGAEDYSTTNIQVEGVDEPDFVKNDGKYIYLAQGNKISVIEVFPAENMKILSKIKLDGEYVQNIFLNKNKLIVFIPVSKYISTGVPCGMGIVGMPCGGYYKQQVKVLIYDVENKDNISLENEIKVSGNYIDARMVGDYVYLISSKYIDLNQIDLPSYEVNKETTRIPAKDIHYFGNYDYSYNFNVISAININSGDINTETYLMGASTNVYASEKNIYLTYMKTLSPEYYFNKYLKDVLMPNLPQETRSKLQDTIEKKISMKEKSEELKEILQDYFGSLTEEERVEFAQNLEDEMDKFYEEISKERQKTIVHKIEIEESNIEYKANGEVPGYVLNQFSMDENNGNLRIATTTGINWGGSEESKNNLYVLDKDLEIVGKVEGLAPGERIYSARFMKERAYMVTFRQVDPLFVIDLSDPEKPEVLGYLKVTGFSNYLHPYDENHIIGIGQEASEQGRAQGVKIALFDVSDVENPKEESKYVVDEGIWSQTDVSYDHKAFLFNKNKELMVLPISYTKEIKTSEEVNGRFYPHYQYWQGAFVFSINLEDGITLRGKINHEENKSENYWYGGNSYVRRSMFMDDVLYTISNGKVKANSLLDLEGISEVEIENIYDYYARGGVAVDGVAVESDVSVDY